MSSERSGSGQVPRKAASDRAKSSADGSDHPPLGNGKLDALRLAEANVDRLEQREGDLLRTGRRLFGVTGSFEYGPLRSALSSSHLSVAPAVAHGILGAAAMMAVVAWPLIEPSLAVSLGVSGSLLPLYELVALTLAALSVLAVEERSRRFVFVLGAVLAAASMLVASIVSVIWGLVVAVTCAGTGVAMVASTQYPLLMDAYRPEVRVRMFSMYTAVAMALTAGGTFVFSFARGPQWLTWRGALVVVGVGGVGAVLLGSVRVRDPGRGSWDSTRLRRLVEGATGDQTAVTSNEPDASAVDIAVSRLECLRQVVNVPTAQSAIALAVVAGFLWGPLPAQVPVLLRDRFSTHEDIAVRLVALAILGGVGGAAWFARRGEIAFRATPSRVVQIATWLGVVAAAALAFAAVNPTLLGTVACLVIACAALAAILPASATVLLSVVPVDRRPHAALVLGASGLAGAIVQRQLVDVIGSRFGIQWAFVVLAVHLVALASAATRSIATADRDFDTVVERVIEVSELRTATSRGRHMPLLRCRRIDFAYDQLQVLFGVDFTVDDGEMVALLGTNGAGKSTLLRAISGLTYPSRGTIHFRGADITHVSPDIRVRLGISQLPGGKAVFGPMSVVDNLRVYGHTHGRDRRAIDQGIDASFAAFPRLAERRNQLAATLSGGEQQMLSIAKAFILRPQLLLIDELTLGLAPVIVGELLDMVRRINAGGTAIVLVEQSVNIALSLVDHAYFMEKGEMRFDGTASALAERPDLLRSVFLEGAARAVR